MQLTRIERREARLRRIRAKFVKSQSEPIEKTPQEHHHIGVSQKYYEHIGTFLTKNAGDPAIRVHTITEMISGSANMSFFVTGLFAQVEKASSPPCYVSAT
jgi:hypothetical protein